MSTNAFIGSQTLLQLSGGVSPEVWTTIGEVVSIGALAQKKDLVEVTHMLSTAKEFIGGLSEGQEIPIVCNLIPADAEQLLLLIAAGTTSVAQHFKYVLPPVGGNSKIFYFYAIVLSSSIGPTEPNKAVQVTFNVKISGSIIGPI